MQLFVHANTCSQRLVHVLALHLLQDNIIRLIIIAIVCRIVN